MRAPHLPKESSATPAGLRVSLRSIYRSPLVVAALLGAIAGGFAGTIVGSREFDRFLYGVDRNDISAIRITRGISSSAISSIALSARVEPVVVRVVSRPKSSVIAEGAMDVRGAGFFVSSDGWVMTHRSVVDRNPDIAIATADARILPVVAVVRDPASDAMFLRVSGDRFSVLPFDPDVRFDAGRSFAVADLLMGSRAVLVTAASAAKGVLENRFSSERLYRFPMLGDRLSPLLLGTPALTTEGVVVGMITDAGSATLGAKILPARAFVRLIPSVLKNGKALRAFLGIEFSDPALLWSMEEKKESAGVMVVKVAPGSPAARSGIINGDRVISLEGEPLTAKRSIPEMMAEYAPGDSLRLRLMRNGKGKEVEVKLGEVKK